MIGGHTTNEEEGEDRNQETTYEKVSGSQAMIYIADTHLEYGNDRNYSEVTGVLQMHSTVDQTKKVEKCFFQNSVTGKMTKMVKIEPSEKFGPIANNKLVRNDRSIGK